LSAPRTFYALRDGGVRLFVRATPGAGRDDIAGLWRGGDGEERLAVKIAAPPDKGKANAAIIKLLSKALGVSKSSLAVVAGETARLKTIEIDGEPEDLARRLNAFAAADG